MALWRGRRGFSSLDPHAYDYLLKLTKPGFAWEFARCNETLRRAAFICRRGAPAMRRIGRNASLHRLRRRYRMAEHFGLHHIPDPSLTADQTAPFGLPGILGSVIGLELRRRPVLRGERFDIDHLPGAKHLIVPVTGAPELILQSENYAGYFASDGQWTLLPRRFFLSVELGAFERFSTQMDSAESFFHAACGHILSPWRERAFGPRRLRRALLAYDIRTAYGGSYLDAPRIIYGRERVEQARRRGDNSLRERARRAFVMGKKLVEGGYFNLLH